MEQFHLPEDPTPNTARGTTAIKPVWKSGATTSLTFDPFDITVIELIMKSMLPL